MLDRILSHYGPDAQQARDSLRSAVAHLLDRLSPQGSSQSSQSALSGRVSEDLYDEVQKLSPKDDAQRSLQSQALNLLIGLGAARWLMFEQTASSFSRPLIIVMVFWLTIIFISWGLFAPSNATALASMLVAARSV